MKAVLVPRAAHHREWCEPFAQGLRRHGWTAEISATARPCDMLVLWGVRRHDEIAAQKWRGGEVCILERGYIGDRFKWTSVSFGGGLNGRAEFRGTRDDPFRFEQNFGCLMLPWRKPEGYALLIGQVPGDMSLKTVHGSLDRWYAETCAALVHHGWEVRFRPHPMAVRRGRGPGAVAGAKTSEGSLQAAMAEAGVVVTFNSNTGVESVLAGVPTISMDGGSMAWEVTSHLVNVPTVTPDRTGWAARLAWKQWTLEEMASGECWEAVK